MIIQQCKFEDEAVGQLYQAPTKDTQYVLDYVLSYGNNDNRSYLKVSILGLEFMGLFVSGAYCNRYKILLFGNQQHSLYST